MLADLCFAIIFIVSTGRLAQLMFTVPIQDGMPSSAICFVASFVALADRYFGWVAAIGRAFS